MSTIEAFLSTRLTSQVPIISTTMAMAAVVIAVATSAHEVPSG